MLREIRTAFRLAQVAALILGGMLTLQMLFPVCTISMRRRIKQAWAARLVRALGVSIDSSGQPTQHGLVVSNHISWLDVFVINAITPTTFVCKDDVRNWPAIGWLVAHAGTLFIARGSRSAAARSALAMAERLRNGERVAIFPEGTTTDGRRMLPFKSALFEAAPSSRADVQPVAIRYEDHQGQPSPAPVYDGDISFIESLFAIARADGLYARVGHLTVLPGSLDRRSLSYQAEQAIAAELGLNAEACMEIPQALAA